MSQLRYFHYISKTKVEMLESQLTTSAAPTTKSELSFNAGIISGKIGHDRLPLDDLIKKLTRVEKHIREHEAVGTIEQPAKWIEGSGSAIIARMTDAVGAVFYFIRNETTYLALGGSRGHLISASVNRSERFGLSFAADLVSSLQMLDRSPMLFDLDGSRLAEFVETGVASEKPWACMIYHQCHGRREKTYDTPISFLARRVLETEYHGKRVILATPLYVEESS